MLYAPGLIQDEVEEQTLTYLLIRPLPRWLVYVTKLEATVVVTALLAAIFTTATEAAIWWDTEDFVEVMPQHAATLSASCPLPRGLQRSFRGAGTVRAQAVGVGVLYMVVLEGIFANTDFIFRRATVMYYFRVLVLRWLEPADPGWSIDLDVAPGSGESVTSLLIASLILTAIAAFAFTVREFRLKTPESA